MAEERSLLEQLIYSGVAEMKQKEFAQKPIRILGEVILLLKDAPPSDTVKLDFTDHNPRRLGSYRGYYEDLSLEYGTENPPMTVEQLLKMFEGAVGKTYQGYKGGDFTMSAKTLIWVAPYGDTGRMLTDIRSKNGITTIITKED